MRSSTGSRGVARPHASVTLYGRASHPTGSMRVAVLHDHLSFIGGGERVALALAAAFDADLFVTDLDPGLPTRAGLRSVRATELGKAPRTPILRQERQAAAFRRAELPGYDVYVFSGNWAIEAAPRHRPNLWYCHTPTRVFYDLREDFLRDLSPPNASLPGLGSVVRGRGTRPTWQRSGESSRTAETSRAASHDTSTDRPKSSTLRWTPRGIASKKSVTSGCP